MKKNCLLTVILCLCLFALGSAQHQTFYGSYYFNPGIYNPSFTGAGRATEISLMHRNQWIGIEDAPVTSSFHMQIPTETKASLGFTVLSDKSVMLRETTFYASFAYMVPLGKNHYVQFGLSGGVGTQHIDMNNANTADPAILQAAQSQIQWLGQFGIHYRKEQLVLGFNVPKYHFTAPISRELIENEKYFNWNHRMDMVMLTANYRLPLAGNKVTLEPILIYRVIQQSANQAELSGIVHLQDLVWIGSSYRQQNGFSAMAGIKIKKKLKIGYVHGLTSALGSSYSLGTHEFQMSLTPGKIKKIRH